MKKLLGGVASVGAFLSFVPGALAQTPTKSPLDASIDAPPGRIIAPSTTIGQIVSFAVAAIIVLAFLFALLYIVIGAFQWITSGGDKQKVADARNHILAAIIGLIVIALSFVIINVVMTALGLGTITNFSFPTLNEFK